jgi:hypothetical protein
MKRPPCRETSALFASPPWRGEPIDRQAYALLRNPLVIPEKGMDNRGHLLFLSENE